MKGFARIIIPLLVSSFINSLTYETVVINYNTDLTDLISNNNMKFYSMDLENKSSDMDLLVDSKIINSNSIYESPIVLVSTEPLPNINKSKQWVCGQLGMETCLIPSSNLKNASKVFFGVVCNACKFTLKSYFINEPLLKEGESQIFHLKENDKIIFKLDNSFNAQKDLITIKSFNMRMTPYKMFVEIIDKNQPDKIINAPISKNWIGGQQANIKPDSQLDFQNHFYRIIFVAEKDGIINVEAKAANSIVKLDDKILKFDSLKDDNKNCYSYNINKENADQDLIFEVKSIKGKMNYQIMGNDNIPKLNGEVSEKFKEKVILNSVLRNNQNDGDWKICVFIADKNEKNALYTMQAYLASNLEHVKEYQKLLFNLLKEEEMYEVQNLQLNDKKEIPLMRMLAEVQKDLKSANTNLLQSTTSTGTAENLSTNQSVNNTQVKAKDDVVVHYHINGNGVAGIAVGFIFLIAVLIGVQVMMAIFVNTKTIDEPLRMGRIEH